MPPSKGGNLCYTAQAVLSPAIYYVRAHQQLGHKSCGNLSTGESFSELIRAVQGVAWIQVTGKGMDWAGDLISFYITVKRWT